MLFYQQKRMYLTQLSKELVWGTFEDKDRLLGRGPKSNMPFLFVDAPTTTVKTLQQYQYWTSENTLKQFLPQTNVSVTEMTVTEAPEFEHFIGPGAIVTQVFMIVFLILAAIFGNSVMCYAVYKTPRLRTVPNIFTINLGITDMAIALLSLPLWITTTITGGNSLETPIPKALCQINGFITTMLLLVLISTIAGISLDRYFCICHPLRYPMEVTTRRVYIALGYIWLQSTLLASAPLYGWGLYTFRPISIPICNPKWIGQESYAIFLIILGLAIPFVIILFSYTKIIMAARKQSKKIKQIQLRLVTPELTHHPIDFEKVGEADDTQTNKEHQLFCIINIFRRKNQAPKEDHQNSVSRNLKTLKIVFIVIGAFFLCWGPYVVVNFWSINNKTTSVPYLADLLTTLFAFLNSAINPLVFMFLNRDFRFAIKIMILRCTQCLGHKDAVQIIRQRSMSKGDSFMMESFQATRSRFSVDSGVDSDCGGAPASGPSGVKETKDQSPVKAVPPRLRPSVLDVPCQSFSKKAVAPRVEHIEMKPMNEEKHQSEKTILLQIRPMARSESTTLLLMPGQVDDFFH